MAGESQLDTVTALNQLLNLHRCSLPMYVLSARPYRGRGDEKAAEVLAHIVEDQHHIYIGGEFTEVDAERAFEAARTAKPRPLPVATGGADPRVGRRVSIAPTDYGTVPVTGTLVAATPSRAIVARETDR